MSAASGYVNANGVRWAKRHFDLFPELKMSGRFLLTALGSFADDAKGYAWPTQQTLSDFIGLEARQIYRELKRLQELGIIAIEKVRGPHGIRNRYRLARWDELARGRTRDDRPPEPSLFVPPPTPRSRPEQPDISGGGSDISGGGTGLQESDESSTLELSKQGRAPVAAAHPPLSRDEGPAADLDGPETSRAATDGALPRTPAAGPDIAAPTVASSEIAIPTSPSAQMAYIWNTVVADSPLQVFPDRRLSAAEASALKAARAHPAIGQEPRQWQAYARWCAKHPFFRGERPGGTPAGILAACKATFLDEFASVQIRERRAELPPAPVARRMPEIEEMATRPRSRPGASDPRPGAPDPNDEFDQMLMSVTSLSLG